MKKYTKEQLDKIKRMNISERKKEAENFFLSLPEEAQWRYAVPEAARMFDLTFDQADRVWMNQ